MKVRYTYQLRPGSTARRYLAREWGMCRYVWNEMVAQSQAISDAWPSVKLAGAEPITFGPARADKFLTHLRKTTVDTTGYKWLADGSSVAQQQTVRDFSAVRSKALADIATGKPHKQRAGMPRFRRKNVSLPTFNYTRKTFSLKPDPVTGTLRLALPGKVSIPVVWSRDLPASPSSVRVYRDSLGYWYASFVVEIEYLPHSPAQDQSAIGIDWGVTETATTARVNLSTGEIDEAVDFDLLHTGHGRKAAEKLAAAQRSMARRKRPKGEQESHGYRLAKFKAARIHKKIARQRRDDARKWAKRLVSDHQLIAVEDFRPKFLAKSTMARKAADAAIGSTKSELIWQARKAGRDLQLVHPSHTTMDCASCGARTKHRLPLGQRIYACESCGVERPRDKNSAAVMVARAGFDPVDVEGVRPRPADVLALAS